MDIKRLASSDSEVSRRASCIFLFSLCVVVCVGIPVRRVRVVCVSSVCKVLFYLSLRSSAPTSATVIWYLRMRKGENRRKRRRRREGESRSERWALKCTPASLGNNRTYTPFAASPYRAGGAMLRQAYTQADQQMLRNAAHQLHCSEGGLTSNSSGSESSPRSPAPTAPEPLR